MSNLDMIKDLRTLTQAGMKDCKEALEESNWDIEKAVDIIKTKGKLVANGNKIAAEGVVAISHIENSAIMVEVNSVTDFVARMPEFNRFVNTCLWSLTDALANNFPWNCQSVETERKELTSLTKENIVVRRSWVEQTCDEKVKLFTYVHTNNKIGTICTVLAPSVDAKNSPEFIELGNNLVLQIAAMSPLAVSPDKLDPQVVARQKAIFQTQLDAMNKPPAAHSKIMEGKMNKWYTEVCLLNQESVISPKTTVEQTIKNVEMKLGGEIKVMNLIRCQVGEGIEKPVDNFADEAVKMAGG